MSRKTFLTALSLALFVVGTVVTTLFLMVRHEPAEYRRAAVDPGPPRCVQSKQCDDEFTQLISVLKSGCDRDWDFRLTDEQINSYFAEGFKASRLEELVLPEGISEPRVLFEPNKLRLAFRAGSGLWSTIISVDFGVWLTEEPNVVALELQGLHAGSLPIGAQCLLERLSTVADQNGIQVRWYRYRGNPVALLAFQSEQRETSVQLSDIQILKGSVLIRGRPVGSASTASLTGTRALGSE